MRPIFRDYDPNTQGPTIKDIERFVFPAYAIGVISSFDVRDLLKLDGVNRVEARYQAWRQQQNERVQETLDECWCSRNCL